jgi:hypothetical protein
MDTIMKRRRYTPEQAVRKIREGERLLNEGQDLVEVLRHLEVSEATGQHRSYNASNLDRSARRISVSLRACVRSPASIRAGGGRQPTRSCCGKA